MGLLAVLVVAVQAEILVQGDKELEALETRHLLLQVKVIMAAPVKALERLFMVVVAEAQVPLELLAHLPVMVLEEMEQYPHYLAHLLLMLAVAAVG